MFANFLEVLIFVAKDGSSLAPKDGSPLIPKDGLPQAPKGSSSIAPKKPARINMIKDWYNLMAD